MLYSDFVKEHMVKLKGTDMSAPQKMKYIAEQWKKSKGSQSESKKEMPKKEMPKKEMPKKEIPKPKKHSNEILSMLGVNVKKSKAKPKTERAVKKVVKAMEKMQIPVEEKMQEIPKHPIHLLEKEEVKQKQMFDDDDIGF
jgi:morphogenetic protein associated with SpoVID